MRSLLLSSFLGVPSYQLVARAPVSQSLLASPDLGPVLTSLYLRAMSQGIPSFFRSFHSLSVLPAPEPVTNELVSAAIASNYNTTTPAELDPVLLINPFEFVASEGL